MSLSEYIHRASERIVEASVELAETLEAGVRWRDVPGLLGSWRISELGHVRYLGDAKTLDARCTVHITFADMYWRANPGTLVLLAFVGPRPANFECCHADDNFSNNALTNVRWDSHGNNVREGIANGSRAHIFGENANRVKLTEAQVIEAIQLRRDGWTWHTLGARYKVHHTTIAKAVTGVNWPHLQERSGT